MDRQKAQAVSTLDRLARQVAVEKQERAEKCKAFKVCTCFKKKNLKKMIEHY